jgi:hypothetical protein
MLHLSISILHIPYATFIIIASTSQHIPHAGFERTIVDEGVVFTNGGHGNLHLVVECEQTNIVV